MKLLILLIAFISFKTFANDEQTLNPFKTDFCTGYREGTRQHPDAWKHCCVEHDLYFWAGGSREERKQTDLRLRDCVENSGYPHQAFLIYTAVTIGGASPIRFKTKEWGHAWHERNRYMSLDEKETDLILDYLENTSLDLSPELLDSFKEQIKNRLDD